MIHVAIAADANYLPYVPTLLNSILTHASMSMHCHLLLHGAKPDEGMRLVFSSRRLTVSPYVVDKWLTAHPLVNGAYVSETSMDRLLLPSLLKDVRKVVYLDVDIAVRGDLALLMRQDTGLMGILAKPSIHPKHRTVHSALHAWPHPDEERAAIRQLIAPWWRSFNNGVMLMDLDVLRSRGFQQRTTAWAARFGLNDQLACGIYAEDRFATLEPNWNVYVGQDHQSLKPWRILHWIGAKKPWNANVALGEHWSYYETSFERLFDHCI